MIPKDEWVICFVKVVLELDGNKICICIYIS